MCVCMTVLFFNLMQQKQLSYAQSTYNRVSTDYSSFICDTVVVGLFTAHYLQGLFDTMLN